MTSNVIRCGFRKILCPASATVRHWRNKHIVPASTTEKAKRAAKDVYYGAIILGGVAVTGTIAYVIYQELAGSNSPQKIYSDSVDLCVGHTKVQDLLGTPIKACGDRSTRNRRSHIRHAEYEINGVQYMKMKFYLLGPRGRATAHVEMAQNPSGTYEYNYLYVQMDTYPRYTVAVKQKEDRFTTESHETASL